jgi:maleate isomerase
VGIRLGVITPSSNTVLEPLTAEMAAEAGATAHFARFPVTEIALDPDALRQFHHGPMLAAAGMLADARMDVILWSGTSAGWLGFEADARLVEAIRAATSIPATTSVLGLNDALAAIRARTIGLLTPYTADVHARIVENYAALGLEVVGGRNFGTSDNFGFARIPPETIDSALRDLSASRPDALVTFCTNMAAARCAPRVEAATGIPVLDTVTTGVWKGLRVAGMRATASPPAGGCSSLTRDACGLSPCPPRHRGRRRLRRSRVTPARLPWPASWGPSRGARGRSAQPGGRVGPTTL